MATGADVMGVRFNPIDLLLTPVHWVERSRGWRRYALVLSYVLIGAVVGVLAHRDMGLRQIPDIGVPYDAEAFERGRTGPESRALGDAYREVLKRLVVDTPGLKESTTFRRPSGFTAWSQIDAVDRDWFERNGPAREAWLAATARPIAPLPPDWERSVPRVPDANSQIQLPARLAALEGSRLMGDGDRSGAWTYYRSVLRASRHFSRSAHMFRRQVGYWMFNMVLPRIREWLLDPGLTAPEARRALTDLAECVRDTPTPEELIAAEAQEIRKDLRDPILVERLFQPKEEGPWHVRTARLNRIHRFLQHEPERSERLLNLMVAQLIAQRRLNPANRAPATAANAVIFEVNRHTPPAVRDFTPARLAAEVENSLLARRGWFGAALPIDEVERTVLPPLLVDMALRTYELEKGRPPAVFRDLLDGYLDALPDGIDPAEPVAGPPG